VLVDVCTLLSAIQVSNAMKDMALSKSTDTVNRKKHIKRINNKVSYRKQIAHQHSWSTL